MEKSAVDFKRLRAQLEMGRGADGRLDAASRGVVVSEVERARRAGHGYREVAAALGVKFQTLMTWRYMVQGRRKRAGKLRRVVLREQASASEQVRSGYLVHGPSAMRVEVSGAAELAALWRALS